MLHLCRAETRHKLSKLIPRSESSTVKSAKPHNRPPPCATKTAQQRRSPAVRSTTKPVHPRDRPRVKKKRNQSPSLTSLVTVVESSSEDSCELLRPQPRSKAKAKQSCKRSRPAPQLCDKGRGCRVFQCPKTHLQGVRVGYLGCGHE